MQENFDRDLLILLHDVARFLRTRSDQLARARGMTRAQWIILARLARQPGLSQNELATICEVEPITIGRLVDRLDARAREALIDMLVHIKSNLTAESAGAQKLQLAGE